MSDNIKTYVMTTQAGVKRMCSGCLAFRPVWVGETDGGDTLTCCGTCQRVLKRIRTADIPPLSVNAGGSEQAS